MNTTQQPAAIVTGASSGIGLGVAQALLERGWRVVGTSRSISSSKSLTPSPDLVLVDGDVGRRETAIKVVDAALKHFGPPAAAGLRRPGTRRRKDLRQRQNQTLRILLRFPFVDCALSSWPFA